MMNKLVVLFVYLGALVPVISAAYGFDYENYESDDQPLHRERAYSEDPEIGYYE